MAYVVVDNDLHWRNYFGASARQSVLDHLIRSLTRRRPHEEPETRNSFAARFEEEAYNSATTRWDYLVKISTQMITGAEAFNSADITATPTTTRGSLRESLKRKLPVVEFGDFLGKSKKKVVDSVCPVCLDCLKTSDEIRELSGCCHAFHKGCLDMWIDRDRLTCPCCRASL